MNASTYALRLACELPGALLFPALVRYDGTAKKWLKRPLTRRGHRDAHVDPAAFDWTVANGVGLVMGGGWYCLDIDDCGIQEPPAQWLRTRGLDPTKRATRTHRTPSGGAHLIFRTATPHLDLPCRQNIVPGLDGRGRGGWIAFSQHYSVTRPAPLDYLPPRVCHDIRAGWTGGAGGCGRTRAAIRQPTGVDARGTRIKLTRALRACRALRERWRGIRGNYWDRQVDATRSGLDHSTACLLAMCAFDYDEIVWLLLNEYEHGACRDPAHQDPVRAACRSAAKALNLWEEEQRLLGLTFESSAAAAEMAEAYLRLIAARAAAERSARGSSADAC